MNTYRYTFVAACPANGEQIVYSLSLQHQDKVLVEHHKSIPYEKGSWGPREADTLLGPHGPWHNPCREDPDADRKLT